MAPTSKYYLPTNPSDSCGRPQPRAGCPGAVDVRDEPDGKAPPPAHFPTPEAETRRSSASPGRSGVRGGTRNAHPDPRRPAVYDPAAGRRTRCGMLDRRRRSRTGRSPRRAVTMEWFRLLDRYQRGASAYAGRGDLPSAYLRAYPDVFRLAGPSLVVAPFGGGFVGRRATTGACRLSRREGYSVDQTVSRIVKSGSAFVFAWWRAAPDLHIRDPAWYVPIGCSATPARIAPHS